MSLRRIVAASFSPTGNARVLARELARALALCLNLEGEVLSFLDLTPPAARKKSEVFEEGELLILALPVYAGRLPNKIIPEVKACLSSGGACAIPLVSYGNRDFGDALSELCLELKNLGFRLPAAAAMVGEHAFTAKLAKGRPDPSDFEELRSFARAAAEVLRQASFCDAIPAGANPPGPYYTPLKEDGSPAKFLKAKPITDPERCDHCGHCAACCPMGSISQEDCSEVPGICIKCQACIRECPTGAKSFQDEDFLSHVRMLEQNDTRRAENTFFLGH